MHIQEAVRSRRKRCLKRKYTSLYGAVTRADRLPFRARVDWCPTCGAYHVVRIAEAKSL